jgi:hypothetical protein
MNAYMSDLTSAAAVAYFLVITLLIAFYSGVPLNLLGINLAASASDIGLLVYRQYTLTNSLSGVIIEVSAGGPNS